MKIITLIDFFFRKTFSEVSETTLNSILPEKVAVRDLELVVMRVFFIVAVTDLKLVAVRDLELVSVRDVKLAAVMDL